MGAKISKRYSSFKSLLNYYKLVLNFVHSGPHKSTFLSFWNFEFPIYDHFKFTDAPYYEKSKNQNYMENERRAKRGEIWDSVSIQCIQGNQFWQLSAFCKVILLSFGTFPIFDKLVFRKWFVQRNGVQFEPRGWLFSVYMYIIRILFGPFLTWPD